jgi:hypothetical protein
MHLWKIQIKSNSDSGLANSEKGLVQIQKISRPVARDASKRVKTAKLNEFKKNAF